MIVGPVITLKNSTSHSALFLSFSDKYYSYIVFKANYSPVFLFLIKSTLPAAPLPKNLKFSNLARPFSSTSYFPTFCYLVFINYSKDLHYVSLTGLTI